MSKEYIIPTATSITLENHNNILEAKNRGETIKVIPRNYPSPDEVQEYIKECELMNERVGGPLGKMAEIIAENLKNGTMPGCYGSSQVLDPNALCPMSCPWVGTCIDLCTGEKKQVQNSNRISKDEYYLGIALAVCKRSTCLKRRYGVVVVKNDEIIATGYNGSPRGEENCCDRGECKRLNISHNSGNYSDCHSVHAEQNAMLSASRKDLLGAAMYITGEEKKCSDDWEEIQNATPCPICTRMIKNAGIAKVVNKEGKICL